MPQINRLSESVISRLRSSTSLLDVAQIAEELVCNSIDAGATQIHVDVDAEAFFMKVDDDGCGISRDDLTLVGERHATSKLHNLEELVRGVSTLGFRGEALSSLSDIAIVEITSRCRGTPNTHRKILKDCATVSIGLCSEQRSHGTTVVVKDIFYNQPVRRRLLNTRKISQSVKERVMRFVLMHPRISFKVTDLARQQVSVHSKSATSLSSTLSGMFGKDFLGSLKEVDYAQGRLGISGYLSRNYHCLSSKTVQFFYINRRFVKKTPIHKLLNTWAQSSKNGPRTLVTSTERMRGPGKQDGISEKHLFPAFVLNLICPLSDYDITFEASKTLVEFKDWLPVVDFVKSILQSMWGELLSVHEGGLIHASGRSPELSVKTDASSKIIRQQTSCGPYTGSNNIPPMSVRRALVQGGRVDQCSPLRGSVAEHRGGGFTTGGHGSRQSRSRPGDPTSPAHDLRGRRREGNVPSWTFVTAGDTIENILAESSSHSSDQTIAPRRWTMASCGQVETPKSVLSSEDIDVFVPSIPAPRSPCDNNSLTNVRLELSPDNASMTPPCMVEGIRSGSDFVHFSSSSSLVKECSESSLADGEMEQSKDLNHYTRLPEVRSCGLVEDVEVEKGGASSKVPDLNMRASLWSGSDYSYNFTSNPDSSDLLPEVRSCSPDVSEVQENFSWVCSGSGSDESGSDTKDKKNTPGKRFTRSEICGPEKFDLNYFVQYVERSRFNEWNDDTNIPGQTEGRSWKLNTEGSEKPNFEAQDLMDHQEFEQAVTKSSSRKPVSVVCERQEPLYLSHRVAAGKRGDSSRPVDKRKLETYFSGQLDNLDSRCDNIDKLEARKYDSDLDICFLPSKRQRRSHSGPPFYIPPSRCGKHDNPPNSLSTIKKVSVDMFESAGHNKKGTGAATKARNKNKRQASYYHECAIDNTSDWSFSPSCIRNGLESNAEDSVERSCPKESCSTRLIRNMDISQVTPVKRGLPDAVRLGENGAAPKMDAIQDMLKEWSNPCMTKDEDVLDLSSGILCWNSIPESIVKERLQHARVLQQVNKKFIPAVADGVLLVIDQHAADERVRLEELRDEILGSGQIKQVAQLSCTQELTMAFSEQQMLQIYREQIEDWGWRFELPFIQSSKTSRAGSSTSGMCNVLLSTVPCILGVMLSRADLTEYLRQLMNTQGSSAPPPAVIRVLNHKACRGAIMFGDTLLPTECRQLVEHLKKTSLCFQCAHGRPTMVPLVDLRALHERLLSSYSNSENSKIFELPSGSTAPLSGLPVKKWHRLQSTRSTLERSLERLKQALE